MDFFNKITADLKASATKTATNVYTATLGKAEAAASKLFGAYSGGQTADLAKGTMPVTAVPQTPAGSFTAQPLAPASLSGAASLPDSSKALLVAVAVIAGLFLLTRGK